MTHREHLILICSCRHLTHAARFMYDAEDDVVYIDVSLVRERRFWRRLVTAWRYLFGNVCGFGDMAEMLLKPEDVPRLRAWLDAVGPGRSL